MTAPRCIVLCDDPQWDLVRSAYECLGAVAALELSTEPPPGPDQVVPRAELLVVPAQGTKVQWVVDLLQRAHMEAPGTPVLVVGADFTQGQIFEVLAAGAYDFVSAPHCSAELVVRVMRGLGQVNRKALPRPMRPDALRAKGLIGDSPRFTAQVARLPLLAGCDAGVLILGETGTGKELFAQAIHYLSSRVSGPWVPVNCGAIPMELIEAELFGHARGAYTTALSAREGLIAAAECGTLFLDEIDSLPLAAQGKLLRFLQEREYRSLGANALRRANVRVIAASNRELAALVASEKFRQDLYFRLNVLTLNLPPLRERREDIPLLALHFLRRFADQFKRPVRALTPTALQRLLAHSWPGNIRELSHAIERAVLLSNSPCITPSDIELGDAQATPEDDSFQAAKARVVEHFERAYIEHALMASGGNITHAALVAKKNRRALWELIRKHRIEPRRFRAGASARAR